MSGRSGSGPLGAVAQICWLGQPSQAEAVPACSPSGPGQCSIKERLGGRFEKGLEAASTRFGGDE